MSVVGVWDALFVHAVRHVEGIAIETKQTLFFSSIQHTCGKKYSA